MQFSELEVVHESGKFLYCYCPVHKDTKRANLCINKIPNNGKPVGFSFCFACGASGQLTEEEVKALSKKKAICRKKAPIDWKQFVLDSMDGVDDSNYPCDLIYAGSSRDFLIGWRNSYTYPMYNEDGEICGVQLRSKNGDKKCIEGSRLGLFLPRGILKCILHSQVLITEGLTDTLTAYNLGFDVIGLPCATFGHELLKKYLENIDLTCTIKAVCDSDKAGIACANKLMEVLDIDKVIIPLPCKDLHEYYLRFGETKTIKLLEG